VFAIGVFDAAGYASNAILGVGAVFLDEVRWQLHCCVNHGLAQVVLWFVESNKHITVDCKLLWSLVNMRGETLFAGKHPQHLEILNSEVAM
jgi:hypothetical protein